MSNRPSKRLMAAHAQLPASPLPAVDAIARAQALSSANFDETV